MKNTRKLILSVAFATLALPSFLFSQEGEPIKWGGFVKVDMFNDSRAVIAARDDMYMLYPAARRQVTDVPRDPQATPPEIITDPVAKLVYIYGNTEDLNAVKQTSITAIQTRINVTLNGPDAFGAKTKGYIEADFFGTGNSYTWLLRNRHAYVELDWNGKKLLAGQTWHPLFVAGYHPQTVQFSPLSPIHPFNRSPQLRYSMSLGGGFNILVAAIYRAYHGDTGPSSNTPTNTDANFTRYKRWADRPDIDVQLLYKSDAFHIGLTIDATELRPYDSKPTYDGKQDDYQIGKNKNKVNGITYQIFGKFIYDKDNNGEVRFNYVQGENTYHLIMLGGYAEKGNFLLDNLTALGVPAGDAKLIKAFTLKEYTPIKVTSYWIQPIWGKDTEYSIILGKIENKGAKEDVKTFYSRGSNVKTVTAVIPQIRWKSGKTILGVMLGYFEAEYMEDDKAYQFVTQTINTLAGIAGSDYKKLSINGITIPNPSVMDSKGVIGDTYKVVDYRIQASIQQNF